MRVNSTKLTLTCKLSPTELAASAKKLSEAILERERLERELKDIQTKKKAEIENMDFFITFLTNTVFTEKEERPVDVDITFDFKAGVKSFVRLDTGEVFKTEKITDAERQQEFAVA